MKPNYLKKYIISSYVLVWALILFVAGPASLIFHAPPVAMWIVRNLIAWSPTYLLLIGWKQFQPGETRMDFVKRCFSGRIRPLMLLGAFGLIFGISILSLCIYATIEGQPVVSHIDLGAVSLPLSVFLAVPYIISNIVVITCLTVLMNIFLEKERNLLYSVMLHFGFNIVYVFLDAGIGFFVILTVLYPVITAAAVLVRNLQVAGKKE